MDHFARLPEGIITEILSFNSAVDASRSSAVSKEFKHAAENDHLWERFLPSDYQEIISTSLLSDMMIKYATKKELYFSLCDSPLLINGGKMSFSLDKRNGNKCFMVGARELQISWKGCWDFMLDANSRFSKVAKLRSIGWIHIQANIKVELLSKNTKYAVYLVFWLERMDGLKSSRSTIRFLSDIGSKNYTSNERFESRGTGNIAKMRIDGWMEIEMGKFYNNYLGTDSGEVEASLVEIDSPHEKFGLIIEGIEFRPVV